MVRKIDPVRHAEKRQEILDAATRCFVRDGFRGASISEICTEARISPGHLYHYFASKEAIIGAMTEAGLELAATRFNDLRTRSNPAAALLDEIERNETIHDRAKQGLIFDILAEAGRNPAIADIVRVRSLQLRAMLAEFLREAQANGQMDPSLDPNLAATILMGIIDGARAAAVRDPGLTRPQTTEILRTLLARFLMPEPHPSLPGRSGLQSHGGE